MVAIVVKGIGSLDALSAKLVAIPGIVHYATSELAGEAVDLVLDGFGKESDPYGRKWAPKKRPNGKPVGIDTGAMKSSVSPVVSGSHFGVSIGVNYAPFLHAPSGRAQRWLVPNKSMGVPSVWVDSYQLIIERIFNERLS